MDFNLETLKKHPYVIGGVVLVGGLVLLYLSSSSGGSVAQSSGGNGVSSAIAADEQIANINAAAGVQNNQTAAQLSATQIAAQSQSEQTQASLQLGEDNTAAQLAATLASIQGQDLQTTDEYQSQQNIAQMQDNFLGEQVNAGVLENTNNNAAAVATTQIQAGVADTAISSATSLQTQAQSIYAAQLPYIESNAGDQKNSGLDATDQTSVFETILAGGNPTVATAGTGASATVATNGNTTGAANISSLTTGLSKVITGLFG